MNFLNSILKLNLIRSLAIICFFSVFVNILIIYYASVDFKTSRKEYMNIDKFNNIIVYDLHTLENREWTINGQVTQYSSYVLTKLNPSKDISFEVYVILSYELQSLCEINIKRNLKCIYNFGKNKTLKIANITSVIKMNFMVTKNLPKYLYRIKCSIEFMQNQNSFDSANVAIIYKDDFRNSLPVIRYLQLQKPIVLLTDKPDISRKGVAHCVHMLRDINDQNENALYNWLEMQKEIGISEISIYAYDVSNSVIDSIKNRYSNKFLKFVNYYTAYEDVCNFQINNVQRHPVNSIYEQILNNCKQSYSYHFELSNFLVFNTHERISTNDCFFNYKFDYKYITNYDIDEIIIPRKFKMDYEFNEINCSNKLTWPSLKYNIYDFADSLFKNHSMLPSSFEFQNVMFFQSEDATILNLIVNHIENNQMNALVLQNISFNRFSLTYEIDSRNYLKSLKRKKNLALCFIKSLDAKVYIKKSFPVIFASLMDMRYGKSIFYSDNTEAIYQHFTAVAKTDLNPRFKLNVNDAFCGHFRKDYNIYYKDYNYSIRNIMIDIEHFLFTSKFNLVL